MLSGQAGPTGMGYRTTHWLDGQVAQLGPNTAGKAATCLANEDWVADQAPRRSAATFGASSVVGKAP